MSSSSPDVTFHTLFTILQRRSKKDMREVDDMGSRIVWGWIACLVVCSGCVQRLTTRAGVHEPVWRFAVAGDSRNCGDVVMPMIAGRARQHEVEFYWHLGDFRWMTDVDEDMRQQYQGTLPLEAYRRVAWGDFIADQVAPFGSLPVYLGIGNHELYKDGDRVKSHADYVTQFAYWLDAPAIHAQRLRDEIPSDVLTAYYHWQQHGVDFIYLDNSGEEGFEPRQVEWLDRVLAADRSDPQVRALVVGMHRALPNSLACGHSMNGDKGNERPASISSGRQAYQALLQWNRASGKPVYVLASHSHYFMAGIFDTPYWAKRGVLPGWIVGTAGARRYPLPENLPPATDAKTFVYGYLLGTVMDDGEVQFQFEELREPDVPPEVIARFGLPFVEQCFRENSDRGTPAPPPDSCHEE